MSADQEPFQTHLFTIRIWREELGGGRVEWRGQLKHLPAGETRYFREWTELQELIHHCVPDFSPPPKSEPRK